MSGPYLKMLPAQWIVFSRANPHLFRPKLELRDELEAHRVLEKYRGRVVDSAHSYGLWRTVLDFEDNWLTDEDQLEVGRFLMQAKAHPRRFALDDVKGLSQAVRRFAVPPLHEWALEVIQQLDERLGDAFELDEAHDMVVNALAALNCGPTRVQMLMDEWYAKDLVSADDHQLVTDFFERVGFSAPDYMQIRRNTARSIVVSESAEQASVAHSVKDMQATREAVGKQKVKPKGKKRKK